MRTLAAKLSRGAIFLIDYGFPEAEYYHPQRHMGTVMCHQAHQVDGDPLANLAILRDPRRLLAVMQDGKFAKAPAIAVQRSWGQAA